MNKKDVKLKTVTEITTKELLFAVFIAMCTGHLILAMIIAVIAGWSASKDEKEDAKNLREADRSDPV